MTPVVLRNYPIALREILPINCLEAQTTISYNKHYNIHDSKKSATLDIALVQRTNVNGLSVGAEVKKVW